MIEINCIQDNDGKIIYAKEEKLEDIYKKYESYCTDFTGATVNYTYKDGSKLIQYKNYRGLFRRDDGPANIFIHNNYIVLKWYVAGYEYKQVNIDYIFSEDGKELFKIREGYISSGLLLSLGSFGEYITQDEDISTIDSKWYFRKAKVHIYKNGTLVFYDYKNNKISAAHFLMHPIPYHSVYDTFERTIEHLVLYRDDDGPLIEYFPETK